MIIGSAGMALAQPTPPGDPAEAKGRRPHNTRSPRGAMWMG
jgi:hypothetical protein